MLPGELQASHGNDPGYKNFLNWIAAGGKHGTLGGMVLNPAAVRSSTTPWGENIHYDAAGNQVSLYRPAPPGVTSPYGPAGSSLSAPNYDPVASRNAFVPDAFKTKNSLTSALATGPNFTPTPPLLAALSQMVSPQETELERQQRLAREAQLGVA